MAAPRSTDDRDPTPIGRGLPASTRVRLSNAHGLLVEVPRLEIDEFESQHVVDLAHITDRSLTGHAVRYPASWMLAPARSRSKNEESAMKQIRTRGRWTYRNPSATALVIGIGLRYRRLSLASVHS